MASKSMIPKVMEVLQLKCGVSVNKMVKASEESQDPAKQWIEIEHSTMHIKEYDSDHDIHKSEDEAEEREMSKTGEEKGEKVSCASVIKEADTNQKQLEEPKSRSVSSNLESQKERRLSSREGDDDSEDDNDVVMVELDEDFVVERVNGGGSEVVNSQEVAAAAAEVIGEQAAPTHRYFICMCLNCG